MSATSSPAASDTPGTSLGPIPGVLWVNTSVMNPDLKVQLLHDWYDEHLIDVLSCPGNGGLSLRYKNVDSSISDYADPNFAARFSENPPPDAISNAPWPYLALVKLTDLAWLTSKQFADMPRVSKQLPPAKDGGLGSAFDAWHAALRSYETVAKQDGKQNEASGRPKYLLSLQTKEADGQALKELLDPYVKSQSFRGLVSYKLVTGLLEYQEPGVLPIGISLLEFDGEEAPTCEAGSHDGFVVRGDVWYLIDEQGDLSLKL